LPGLTFGVAGGLVIIFEFLLWPRKKLRIWRVGRVELWLRAHIWLGLLSVPLVIYHSGFRMGGTFSSVLMLLFLAVIVSGIVGLVLQQVLPARLLQNVPAETIYSQIDRVLGQLADEADRLVRATCGPGTGTEQLATVTHETADVVTVAPLTLGAIGHVGRVQGRVLQTIGPGARVAGAELLLAAYDRTIGPYLHGGAPASSTLRSRQQAEAMFCDLLTKLDPAAHQTVQALQSLCEQRRQLDEQARWHFWLHSWLWVHLPLSVALLVLLLVHIWGALQYW
jgi:hypothetical protein